MRERITQERLAEIVSSSKSTISGYETGNRSPDSNMLISLANHFGVSVDYLLGITDVPFRATAEGAFENEQEIKLIAAYRKLNADAQSNLLEFLQSIDE